jgi:benzoate membrane transport protein
LWKKNIFDFPRYLSIGSFSNGFVSWIFGATGPLLLILQAASIGHLNETSVSSWIFGIYGMGGLLTLILSLYYRQPIGYAFSIPGAILVGSSLSHHTLNDVVGAYLVTGIVIFLLGISGVISVLMKVLPLPIMMGMVSGVLLPFGTDMIRAVLENPLINGLPILVFLLLSLFKNLSKKVPPILGAIIVSVIMLKIFPMKSNSGIALSITIPHVVLPSFNLSTMGELVLPLVLTVIAIQNAQGIAVLESHDYRPPINAMSFWSGIGSILNSFVGAHPACIAGPMTGILAGEESGKKENRYTAAIVLGILSCLLAVFAPVAASIPNLIPASLIKTLGGLAMIGVLIDSLKMSFSQNFKAGSLFSFLITVSGISIFHIGAPFWGLLGGTIAAFFLDKNDFAKVTIADTKSSDSSQLDEIA